MTIRRISLAAGLVLAAVGCSNDDLITSPVPPYKGGAMFQRYVAMGNSITAGFQSGGINDSTQQQSYAVKLSAAMEGDKFYRPSLTIPGCPPPIDTLFTASGTPHRLGGTAAPPCSLRSAPLPPYISNVAVPGATSFDPFSRGPTVSSNALTLLILGGRSQVEAAAAGRPTFVSAWIGNNDVLGAAIDPNNAGNPLEVTPVALFESHYDSLLAGLDSIPTLQGRVLIGVANVTLIPYFVKGSKFFNVKFGADTIPGPPGATKFPGNFLVNPNCASPQGDSILVPFPRGAAVVAFARGNPADTVGVDCADIHNISPAELVNLDTTVAAYNAFIASRATARGYAYVDPNALFAVLPAGAIPDFPNLPPLATAFTTPFGTYFTFDGIHPSNATHHLIAQVLVQTINATYGSAIPLAGVP